MNAQSHTHTLCACAHKQLCTHPCTSHIYRCKINLKASKAKQKTPIQRRLKMFGKGISNYLFMIYLALCSRWRENRPQEATENESRVPERLVALHLTMANLQRPECPRAGASILSLVEKQIHRKSRTLTSVLIMRTWPTHFSGTCRLGVTC